MTDVVMPHSFGSAFQALAYSSVFNLAVGASSAQSNTFTGNCITLVATTDCWCSVLQNTAVPGATSSFFLPKGVFFSLAIPSGSGRVAVIQDSAGGFLTYMVAQKG
jgi:hypothetical protein